MSSKRTYDALLTIRDNIYAARSFVEGADLQAFQLSRLRFYAAVRVLEIISEASRRLPEAMRERHAHLEWRSIRDAGNFYRHAYDNVQENYVWATIHERLPPLLLAVEEELTAFDD